MPDRNINRGPDWSSTWEFSEVIDSCQQVRDLFVQRQIGLHRDSALSMLLRKSSDAAAATEDSPADVPTLLMLAHGHRIISAILATGWDLAAEECLRRMSSGEMDLGSNKSSPGKDALWELEFLANLRAHGLDARLEEPDVVVYAADTTYPFACKRIYSANNAEGQLRRGVQQLEKYGKLGVVAFNHEALLMEQSILRSPNMRAAGDLLASLNRDFLDSMKAQLARYVRNRRCHGAVASVDVLVEIPDGPVRFSTHAQTTFMTFAPPALLSPALAVIAHKLSHT